MGYHHYAATQTQRRRGLGCSDGFWFIVLCVNNTGRSFHHTADKTQATVVGHSECTGNICIAKSYLSIHPKIVFFCYEQMYNYLA
jgi:hypothetical protein